MCSRMEVDLSLNVPLGHAFFIHDYRRMVDLAHPHLIEMRRKEKRGTGLAENKKCFLF